MQNDSNQKIRLFAILSLIGFCITGFQNCGNGYSGGDSQDGTATASSFDPMAQVDPAVQTTQQVPVVPGQSPMAPMPTPAPLKAEDFSCLLTILYNGPFYCKGPVAEISAVENLLVSSHLKQYPNLTDVNCIYINTGIVNYGLPNLMCFANPSPSTPLHGSYAPYPDLKLSYRLPGGSRCAYFAPALAFSPALSDVYYDVTIICQTPNLSSAVVNEVTNKFKHMNAQAPIPGPNGYLVFSGLDFSCVPGIPLDIKSTVPVSRKDGPVAGASYVTCSGRAHRTTSGFSF